MAKDAPARPLGIDRHTALATNGKRPPVPRRAVPRGPAVVVLGIVGVLLAVGLTGMALLDRSGSALRTGTASGPPGVPMRSVTADFAPLGASVAVPADVLAALEVPSSASVRSRESLSRGVGSFDGQVTYIVPMSYSAVVSVFEDEFGTGGWTLKGEGPASRGTGEEILGERAGSDGNYWEAGVVVSEPASPTSSGPTSAPATPAAQASKGPTVFSVRLFQVSSAD